MPHTRDPIYSEIIFRIDENYPRAEQVRRQMDLSNEEFSDALGALMELRLVEESEEGLVVNWDKLKESFVLWMDRFIESRRGFTELIENPRLKERYASLALWTARFREEVQASEALTGLFRTGCDNFRYLLRQGAPALSIQHFFREFAISIADEELIEEISDPTMSALSKVCRAAIVNPFFSFTTKYASGAGEPVSAPA